jgi:hypothetical protein
MCLLYIMTNTLNRIRILVKYSLLHYGPQIAQQLLNRLISQATGLSAADHDQLHDWSLGGRGKPKPKPKAKKKVKKQRGTGSIHTGLAGHPDLSRIFPLMY